MKVFENLDYLHIKDLFSEEERLVADTVRGFVEEEVIPIIANHARDGKFPAHLIKTMGEMGLLGSSLKGYGCAGMSSVAYGLAMQELERGDSSIRSFASVQGSLCMYPIYAYGTEAQKKKWLPAMAKGEKVGCFGLTEPDFGSNPSGMLTKAEKKNGKWIIHGTKMWITNGTMADLAIVWAKVNGRIRGFIVEKGAPGFTAREVKGKLSLRASDTAELSFDRCEIPEDNLLPETDGLKSPLGCLNQARFGIAWGALGAAHACFYEALSYAKNRIQFEKPIASFQLVQAKLADMATEITKAQLLALRVGRLKDEGRSTAAQISMAKRNNVKIALDVSRQAREILGANGILDEYHAMRHMNNLESVYTYEGTHDIHTLIIGEAVTGIPAYK
ncbi:MAG: acyl-CoA dehydrogenase family protein [Bdellovibrionales bacterium]|nr:acyl-CoA dehydrogenase family protein [Bdellovibrionales bacterium]